MYNLLGKTSSQFLPIFIVIVIYTIIVYTIAFIATRYTKKVSDYILGGRNLGGFVTALSAGASDMSSWLLMAVPGIVLNNGISIIWMILSLTIGAYANWRLISKRLRIHSEVANNSLTIPAFLANKFNIPGKNLRLVTGIILMIFLSFYAVAGFVSSAKLFKLTFGLNYHYSLWLSGIFIVAYTTIGGFLAVSWIDVFQGMLMFFALLIVPFVVYSKIHNLSDVIGQIKIENPGYFNFFEGITIPGIISLIAWGMGYVGQPHIIGKFMAIRSHRELPIARTICTVWMFISMVGAVCVGLLGAVYFKNMPLEDSETVFLQFSKIFFNPWINGILICAVLSSIMSTVSCLILMSASALVEDFYHVIIPSKNIERKRNVWMHRMAVVFISVLSLWIASNPNLSVLESVAFPWCGLGASFGPVIIMSLYWKRLTSQGALAGILTGGGFVILWEILSRSGNTIVNHPSLLAGFSILPAFCLSVLVIILVSLKTKYPTEEVISKFEEVQKKLNEK